MQFYTYLWIRENGVPYYAGKGTGTRAYKRDKHHCNPPSDFTRIIIMPKSGAEEALDHERKLIAFFGRKDQGTGCLRNLTDGGDGLLNPSKETRLKMRNAKLGVKPWNTGRPFSTATRKKMSEAKDRARPATCPKGHTRFRFQKSGTRINKRRCLDCGIEYGRRVVLLGQTRTTV